MPPSGSAIPTIPSPALLTEEDHRAVRLVALALLERTAGACVRLADPHDTDALHDFRVAVRRLRTWLDLHRALLGRSAPKKVRRRLRRLGHETNALRDGEVLAAWLVEVRRSLPTQQRPAADWMLRRIVGHRRTATAALRREVGRDFEGLANTLTRRLEHYEKLVDLRRGIVAEPFAAEVASRLREQTSRLRRRMGSLPPALESGDDARITTAVHRARIAGKRLRYLLEPIAAEAPQAATLIAQLESLQDLLGEHHDARVWMGLIDAAVPRAPRVALRQGLAALRRRMALRASERLDTLQKDWLAAEPALFGALEALADQLGIEARRGVEVERKYLLDGMPASMPEARVQGIVQGYLPGKRLVERVRRVREDGRTTYLRTVKGGAGLARLEVEEACTATLFKALWPLTAGRRVLKERHLLATDHGEWAIDRFSDRDLVLAEIELPSREAEVELPAWLAPHVVREVTDEPPYSNASLARRRPARTALARRSTY